MIVGRVPCPRAAAVALSIVGALALGACGGDGAQEEPEALGETRVGSVAQLAQCRDWNAGTREQQLETLDEIKAAINLKDGPVETPELSDEAALDVIDSTCSNDFADGFRLYKVYARAAGFASFAD